jgi:hypothetical protein
MLIPTADDIRSLSRVPFAELGWGAPADVSDPDMLDEELQAIIPWLEDVTGYAFDDSHLDTADPKMTVIPVRLEALMRKALRMAAEFEAYKQAPDQVEAVIDFGEIQQFTAGSYSETRRDVRDMRYFQNEMVHPWPELNKLLTGTLIARYKRSQSEVPVVGVVNPHRQPGREYGGYGRPIFNPFGDMILTPQGTWGFQPDLSPDLSGLDWPVTGLPNG